MIMAKRMRRIEVDRRKFGFTYGNTFLGIKEYRTVRCAYCGHRLAVHDVDICMADCLCRGFKQYPLLSFVIPLPPVINRRTMRKIIGARILGQVEGVGGKP
jgi:hypothetical protein